MHTHLHHSPRLVLFMPFLCFLCYFLSCWPATSFGEWLQRAHLMANLHILLCLFSGMSILFLCYLNLCIPHLIWSHFSVIILKRKYAMLLFSLKFSVMGCHASCSPHVADLITSSVCISLWLVEHCSIFLSILVCSGKNPKKVCFNCNGKCK